jgi:hypothetical protein
MPIDEDERSGSGCMSVCLRGLSMHSPGFLWRISSLHRWSVESVWSESVIHTLFGGLTVDASLGSPQRRRAA